MRKSHDSNSMGLTSLNSLNLISLNSLNLISLNSLNLISLNSLNLISDGRLEILAGNVIIRRASGQGIGVRGFKGIRNSCQQAP